MIKLEDRIDAVELKLEQLKTASPIDAAEIDRVKTEELEPLLARLHKRNHYRHNDLLGMLFGGIAE